MFNVFKSAIAYDTSIKTLPMLSKAGGEGAEEMMVEYEFEPDTKEEVMEVTFAFCSYLDEFHDRSSGGSFGTAILEKKKCT